MGTQAFPPCMCGATIGAYMALIAGDRDYELTLHGVRFTKEAVERQAHENEERLRNQVAQREQKCGEMELTIAKAKALALDCEQQARTAPGGINGVVAQQALGRAKGYLLQIARVGRGLQQERVKVETGHRALEAISASSRLREDRELFSSIHANIQGAEISPEQITWIQDSAEDAIEKFTELDEQNEEYNDLVQTLDQSLSQSVSTNTMNMFGGGSLNDSESLLEALASMRSESHQVATLTEVAIDNAPHPPTMRTPQHSQYGSFTHLVQGGSEQRQRSVAQSSAARVPHSQGRLPMDQKTVAAMF